VYPKIVPGGSGFFACGLGVVVRMSAGWGGASLVSLLLVTGACAPVKSEQIASNSKGFPAFT
jgi:hypothetical protein